MEKPVEMLHKQDFEFDIWYEYLDPNFTDICKRSRLPEKWISFQKVLSGKYSDSILKPINRYVEQLYPAPALLGITNNTVTLQQKNHAEFFMLETEGGNWYTLDRPWMRQYYKSNEPHRHQSGHVPMMFKFYVPWIIDSDIPVRFVQAENSPFTIYEDEYVFSKTNSGLDYYEPPMVRFQFKTSGDHMEYHNFGRILRQSPMFNITFEADDIIVESVRKFYEQV